MRALFLLTLLLSFASSLQAHTHEWTLVSPSSVSIISTKNSHVSEVHEFTSVSGVVDAQGKADVIIDLASLETNIPIRNERIQKYLFEVTQFAKASIDAQIPQTAFTQLQQGKAQTFSLEATLNLHDHKKALSIPVQATPNGKTVVVNTITPILISAKDFGLDTGIEALRDIAKLKSIGYTVPVSFSLVFELQSHY